MRFLGLFLALLFASETANCEDWSSVAILTREMNQASVVKFIFKGKIFEPAVQVHKPQGKIDRSSPETLLEACFKAYNEQDTNIFNEVFHATAVKVGYTPNDKNIVRSMQLRGKIQYGDLVIMLVETDIPVWHGITSFVFKKEDGAYRGLLPEPKDKTLQLLNSFMSWGSGKLTKEEFKANSEFDYQSHLYFTNAFGGDANLPIIVELNGRNFHPPITIATNKIAGDNVHGSAIEIFKAASVYTKKNDPDPYIGLIDPDDLSKNAYPNQPNFPGTVEEFVRKQMPTTSLAFLKTLKVTQEISCGDLTFLFYRTQDARETDTGWWNAFLKKENKWYLSNAMNARTTHAGLCFPVLRFLDLPMNAHPNVLLSVSSQ